MWETVPRLLAQHRYLVLGTADAEGRPWVTPVFYAADGEHRVLWVSSADSRHSRNISVRPAVAVTIFDSHAPVGEAEAIYLEATAGRVSDDAVAAALERLNTRLPAGHHLGPEDIAPAGPLQVYQATIAQHFVLIRGGDARFGNVVDARLAVTPP
jgi:nitroimidazol reductase NimA-like FMN-containing flavoprotein (pyridoxamine 5'-phosphate oxidase superfamily)